MNIQGIQLPRALFYSAFAVVQTDVTIVGAIFVHLDYRQHSLLPGSKNFQQSERDRKLFSTMLKYHLLLSPQWIEDLPTNRKRCPWKEIENPSLH